MRELQPQYLSHLADYARRLEALRQGLLLKSPVAATEVLRLARFLRGSGATYGIGRVTLAARALVDTPQGPQFRPRLDLLIACLREQAAQRDPRIKTVLVAEDDPDLAELLKLSLANGGTEVVLAATFEQLLEVLQGQPVDLLVLSINLPDKPGAPAVRAVRERFAAERLALLAWGVEPAGVFAAPLLQAGADAYHEKPCNIEAFIQAIRSRIGNYRPAETPDPVTAPIAGRGDNEGPGLWRRLERRDLPPQAPAPPPPRSESSQVFGTKAGSGLAQVGVTEGSVQGAAARVLSPPQSRPSGVIPTNTAAPAWPKHHAAARQSSLHTAAPVSVIPKADTKLRQVIVIDGDQEFAGQVASRLRQEGFEVLTAADGWAGFMLVQPRRPALVIIAVDAPVLDGLSFVSRLRALASHAKVPVLLLGGEERGPDMMRAFQAGSDDWLQKPVAMPDLVVRVHRMTRGAEQVR